MSLVVLFCFQRGSQCKGFTRFIQQYPQGGEGCHKTRTPLLKPSQPKSCPALCTTYIYILFLMHIFHLFYQFLSLVFSLTHTLTLFSSPGPPTQRLEGNILNGLYTFHHLHSSFSASVFCPYT